MKSIYNFFKKKKTVTYQEMAGNDNYNAFSQATLENTPVLGFDGQSIDAKVLQVYDGDTITVAIPFLGSMFKWKCRMIGIDTPEIRTRNDDEKRMGFMARDALRARIADTVVRLECGKFDKYGRLLATVHAYEGDYGTNDTTNINQWMLDQGFARSYDGGKREPWLPADTIMANVV